MVTSGVSIRNGNIANESIGNVAIIYETPGGSTCQVNIAYDHNTGDFSYLNPELAETIKTDAVQDVLAMVETHVRSIPDKRVRRLQSQIDGWVGEGKTRSQLFGELNKLLQTEFLGGRINTNELKQAIQYAIERYPSQEE